MVEPTLGLTMLQIRRSEDRGHAEHGWLDSRHTFSFAGYHDPQHMGFGPLRVINEDRVVAGAGFGTHPHRDMEIITYVLDGALEHRDSMGTGSTIRPGDVQHMSAGSGVTHSEFNASKQDPVHFLQLWIMPNEAGGDPRYGQRHIPRAERLDTLRVVASPDGRDDSLQIKQDACIHVATLTADASVEHVLSEGRRVWLHVAKGAVVAAQTALGAGDALATDEAGTLRITATQDAEVLVFDLP